MDAPEGRRPLAGGRVPVAVRRAGAAVTLAVPLAVSYFVASLVTFDLRPDGARLISNIPLLVASILIGATGIAAARRILDHRPASPWLTASLILPAVAALQEANVL